MSQNKHNPDNRNCRMYTVSDLNERGRALCNCPPAKEAEEKHDVFADSAHLYDKKTGSKLVRYIGVDFGYSPAPQTEGWDYTRQVREVLSKYYNEWKADLVFELAALIADSYATAAKEKEEAELRGYTERATSAVVEADEAYKRGQAQARQYLIAGLRGELKKYDYDSWEAKSVYNRITDYLDNEEKK